jgi:1-acyl-sn-glycerol-3-phosphate acyltransferase
LTGRLGQVPASEWAALSRVERTSLTCARALNRSPRARRWRFAWSTQVVRALVDLLSSKRLVVAGSEHLSRLPADRGILLAPNHRSFFDLFVAARVAYARIGACNRLYFPVRSSFWYDSLAGLAVNVFATGCSMYPPIFRPAGKRAVTRAGLDFLASELRRPGTLAGMHPEGTRGRGSDPYLLLPPEGGFGRVVLLARPSVVPVFVDGLGNSLLTEARRALSGARAPIRILFGAPLELSAAEDVDPSRLRAQIEIGRRALASIGELAEAARTLA